MKKWYYLSSDDGNLHYIGEFNSIDEADEYLYNNQQNAVWIFSEDTAAEWKKQLEFFKV